MEPSTQTAGTKAAQQMVKDALPKGGPLTERAEAAMNQLRQARLDGIDFDKVNLKLEGLDTEDLRNLEAAIRTERYTALEASMNSGADTLERTQAAKERSGWDTVLASVQMEQLLDEQGRPRGLGIDVEDAGIDIEKRLPGERASIAVELTEEQTKLLLSAEYPNDGAAQKTALAAIYADGDEVSIMNESVLLDYSHDQKTFFAELERDEKPALDAKLTQLQAVRERDQQRPAQDPRQRERTAERSR